VHVDLMQFTVKKSILHVKLKDGPPMNRGHRNRSKSLLIVMTVLLLKTTDKKLHHDRWQVKKKETTEHKGPSGREVRGGERRGRRV
jgi:hypothetical protein